MVGVLIVNTFGLNPMVWVVPIIHPKVVALVVTQCTYGQVTVLLMEKTTIITTTISLVLLIQMIPILMLAIPILI